MTKSNFKYDEKTRKLGYYAPWDNGRLTDFVYPGLIAAFGDHIIPIYYGLLGMVYVGGKFAKLFWRGNVNVVDGSVTVIDTPMIYSSLDVCRLLSHGLGSWYLGDTSRVNSFVDWLMRINYRENIVYGLSDNRDNIHRNVVYYTQDLGISEEMVIAMLRDKSTCPLYECALETKGSLYDYPYEGDNKYGKIGSLLDPFPVCQNCEHVTDKGGKQGFCTCGKSFYVQGTLEMLRENRCDLKLPKKP